MIVVQLVAQSNHGGVPLTDDVSSYQGRRKESTRSDEIATRVDEGHGENKKVGAFMNKQIEETAKFQEKTTHYRKRVLLSGVYSLGEGDIPSVSFDSGEKSRLVLRLVRVIWHLCQLSRESYMYVRLAVVLITRT